MSECTSSGRGATAATNPGQQAARPPGPTYRPSAPRTYYREFCSSTGNHSTNFCFKNPNRNNYVPSKKFQRSIFRLWGSVIEVVGTNVLIFIMAMTVARNAVMRRKNIISEGSLLMFSANNFWQPKFPETQNDAKIKAGS